MSTTERLAERAEAVVPPLLVKLWRETLGSRTIPKEVEKKGTDRRDLTTADDRLAEEYLVDALMRAIPEAEVIGEEMSPDRSPQSGCYWVIDPIDGTLNYTEGVRSFSTSVALFVESRPVFGCIYDPTREELFHCRQGNGVYLNGAAVPRLKDVPLERAIVAFGLGYDDAKAATLWSALGRIRQRVKGLRATGCASLDLAYVAADRFACFVHPHLAVWDRSAGEMMVREVCGKFIDVDAWAGGQMHGYVAGTTRVVDFVLHQLEKEFA